ncbi:hypothetical protein IGI04_041381 [Brassica rapa subsp. trilocularis]|uniref:DUF4005 domain-containing protein n=1 Tax=Brassica rapa subsp. trilocularis TaxID=1813537 RepID=A0ABQ7KQN0_BRACM|nr:hypothetical protein IGI04_041381 [Brassica rapa subsp. trilocularis]
MTRKKKPKDMPPRSSPAVSVESSVSTGPSASAPVLPITAFPSERSSDLEVPKLPESLIAPASSCPVNFQSSSPPEVAESEKPNSQISATVEIVPEDESTEATSGLPNSGKYPQIAILPAPVSPKSPIANRKSPSSNGAAVQTSLWKEKHTTADCTRTNANLDRSKVNTAKRNGKAPIQSQLPFVGSGVTDTGRPKNPSKVLSKTKNVPTKQWQPTKNNSINQPSHGVPAVVNGHKQPASSSHDLTLGDFFCGSSCWSS